MKKLILFLAIAIFLISCEFFRTWDFGSGYKLGKNTEYQYNIILDKADTTFYYDYGDGIKYLEEGVLVKFHRANDKIDSFLIWKGTSVIQSYINKVQFDSIFIVVDQKPLDSIWGKYININYAPRRTNEPARLDDAEKKLRDSKIHCYWIIDKRTNDIYGPLSWKEYIHKRKELGVPKELKLKKKEY